MRPTVSHPEWGTPYNAPGVHLDVSPRAYFEEEKSVDEFLGKLRLGFEIWVDLWG